MKRKNLVLAVAILVAVVAIGIGYALSATNLTVNGTANAATTDDFEVAFDGQNSTTGTIATATAGAHDTTGTCSVTLKDVNETASCTFEFQNYSPTGINATIDSTKLVVYSDSGFTTAWTNSSSQYFDVAVTPAWTGTATLTPSDTQSFTVTVTLKKAWIGDTDHTENFYVRLADITAVQA